jgi:hypothetical protein
VRRSDRADRNDADGPLRSEAQLRTIFDSSGQRPPPHRRPHVRPGNRLICAPNVSIISKACRSYGRALACADGGGEGLLKKLVRKTAKAIEHKSIQWQAERAGDEHERRYVHRPYCLGQQLSGYSASRNALAAPDRGPLSANRSSGNRNHKGELGASHRARGSNRRAGTIGCDGGSQLLTWKIGSVVSGAQDGETTHAPPNF